MAKTLSDLLDSVEEKVCRVARGELDELTIKRKPSGKVYVETKTETGHEVHEAPRG